MAHTVTVRRPNGNIEIVDVTAKFASGMNETIFAAMREQIRKAGRGELIRWDNADGYNSDLAAADRANRKANKARRATFDRLYNEGGEGYNPYR